MKYIRCFLYFFTPSFVLKLFNMGAIILANEVVVEKGASIGHFNVIIINKLHIKKNARIGNLNFIKGFFDLLMEEKAGIELQNKISRILSKKQNHCLSKVHLKYHAKIGVKHLLDATSTIIIGENSMLAGAESQIWTHGFYFSKNGEKVVRIDGDVNVGHNCYIGARCVILSGVRIGDTITVGANTCVSKSILERGCYVSQPMRFFPFDPDEEMEKLGMPITKINDIDIYKK